MSGSPTWMGMKNDGQRSPCSTVPLHRSGSSIRRRLKRSLLRAGLPIERRKEGVSSSEMGVFVRSTEQLARAEQALKNSRLPYRVLDDRVETLSGSASIATMHLAKGLEFR